ncbi:hypothetical protein PMAYCL1PPCAC_26914, partial [Pristionchus mayeri]
MLRTTFFVSIGVSLLLVLISLSVIYLERQQERFAIDDDEVIVRNTNTHKYIRAPYRKNLCEFVDRVADKN